MSTSSEGERIAFATDHAPSLGRDCIFVKDWVVDCNIGVYAEEKGVTQKVRLYVDAYLRSACACELRRRHGRCAVVHGHHRCG